MLLGKHFQKNGKKKHEIYINNLVKCEKVKCFWKSVSKGKDRPKSKVYDNDDVHTRIYIQNMDETECIYLMI